MPTPADRQLPLGDEILLDHVGHFVRDVEAARSALTRAGFAPAPVSIQTQPDPAGSAPRLTGTGNVTAMLTRGYMEVLFKTADTPLGLELDAALARYAGVHLAAFAIANAEKHHHRLGQEGFRVRPLVHMQREVDVGAVSKAAGSSPPPCGEGVGVAVDHSSSPPRAIPLPNPPPQGGRERAASVARFTVARLEPGEMPEGRIQLLTHHTEPLVWQPRWLTHPNGALGLEGIVIAVHEPEEAATRFARLTGRPAQRCASGFILTLDRGCVELMHAGAFAEMLPGIEIPSLPFIGAYRLRIASLPIVRQYLEQGRLAPRQLRENIYCAFPPELGNGAWLFSSANAGG